MTNIMMTIIENKSKLFLAFHNDEQVRRPALGQQLLLYVVTVD